MTQSQHNNGQGQSQQYGQSAFQGMPPAPGSTTAQQLFNAVQGGWMEAKYEAETYLAINRDTREQEAHDARRKSDADRQAAEARRNALDEQYRQAQLQFQLDRNDRERAQFVAASADRMARTYGQLLYWEEELMLRRKDVSERHKQAWKRIELEALSQRASLEIQKWRALEGQRHNQVIEAQDLQSRTDRHSETVRHDQVMEAQDLQSRVARHNETVRHNRQTELQDWMVQQARLTETQRHNRAQEDDQDRRTDLMEDDYRERHRDMGRRTDLMETNYEEQQRVAWERYWESVNHNVVMEQLQSERGASRWGKRLLGALIVIALFVGSFWFMAYVFLNWTHFR
jgi:hypothetical protein